MHLILFARKFYWLIQIRFLLSRRTNIFPIYTREVRSKTPAVILRTSPIATTTVTVNGMSIRVLQIRSISCSVFILLHNHFFCSLSWYPTLNWLQLQRFFCRLCFLSQPTVQARISHTYTHIFRFTILRFTIHQEWLTQTIVNLTVLPVLVP